MTKISAKEARQALQNACQKYIVHNQVQLSKSKAERSQYKSCGLTISSCSKRSLFSMHIENFNSGFKNWVSCVYAFLFDQISCWRSTSYYEDTHINASLRWSNTFIPNEVFLQQQNRQKNEPLQLLVLYSLQHLCDFMIDTFVNQRKVENFKEQWMTFHTQNYSVLSCHDQDLSSAKIYLNMRYLRSLLQFISSLYPGKYTDHLLEFFDNAIPTLERFIKGAVVQDLQAILDDTSLTDEAALTSVAWHLKDPMVRGILEKDLQSKAEHIFKVLSVILIAVGIGIIPTVILASKRLYDSGGKSINFFKPLSKQVEGDLEQILLNAIKSSVL